MLRLCLLAAALAVAGCSVEPTPLAAPATPTALAPEAQDPCTRLALQRLDGQLRQEPAVSPEVSSRADAVAAQLVTAYDAVLTRSGVQAARAAVAADVAAACAGSAAAPPAGSPPAGSPAAVPPAPAPPADEVPPPAVESPDTGEGVEGPPGAPFVVGPSPAAD